VSRAWEGYAASKGVKTGEEKSQLTEDDVVELRRMIEDGDA
jgi:hypothetical protein